MGTPYTLQKKKNPQRRDDPAKWYAVPKSGDPVDENVMTRLATQSTTVDDIELAASAKLIARWLHNQLIQGKRAKVPGLGTFRLTFGSEGVENIDDFHTGLIRNVKLNFIPDNDLRADILRDLTFENAGVMDEGTFYGSLENYRQVKGLGSTDTGTGGTGGGTGDSLG